MCKPTERERERKKKTAYKRGKEGRKNGRKRDKEGVRETVRERLKVEGRKGLLEIDKKECTGEPRTGNPLRQVL